MPMFVPVRNKEKEAQAIINFYAKKGIIKELEKMNKKIKIESDKLFSMSGNNSTARRRATSRSKLESLCVDRDRHELALEILKAH